MTHALGMTDPSVSQAYSRTGVRAWKRQHSTPTQRSTAWAEDITRLCHSISSRRDSFLLEGKSRPVHLSSRKESQHVPQAPTTVSGHDSGCTPGGGCVRLPSQAIYAVSEIK